MAADTSALCITNYDHAYRLLACKFELVCDNLHIVSLRYPFYVDGDLAIHKLSHYDTEYTFGCLKTLTYLNGDCGSWSSLRLLWPFYFVNMS
jgi:hypothetical protein